MVSHGAYVSNDSSIVNDTTNVVECVPSGLYSTICAPEPSAEESGAVCDIAT